MGCVHNGWKGTGDIILKALAVVQVRDAGWVDVIPTEMGKKSGQIWNRFWWSNLLDMVIE